MSESAPHLSYVCFGSWPAIVCNIHFKIFAFVVQQCHSHCVLFIYMEDLGFYVLLVFFRDLVTHYEKNDIKITRDWKLFKTDRIYDCMTPQFRRSEGANLTWFNYDI